MTLYEFNILSFEEKQKQVWEKGLFLDNYCSKTIRINCYAIDRFFVEVHYSSVSNTITDITAFKYGDKLDKYSNLNKDNWGNGDIFLAILCLFSGVIGAILIR